MKETLISDIIEKPTSYTVSKWIIERVPFLFEENLENYILWKERLSEEIGVDSKAIIFTGSSCVGYSMNPYKNLSEFSLTSDIDVAVVSGFYFDSAWHYLRNIGTAFYNLKPKEKNAIVDHRKRLIYHGTIATDKIVQLLPFGARWVEAMNVMSKIDPTKDRQINFRIYRDFEALKAYQLIGTEKIKDQLLRE